MKVSVVTPSYNQGRFIEATLASVASQAGAQIEHIVVDGASSDETVAILERFQPAPRWSSRRDDGQADAVNQGIAASDGEVIGWLNSDDVYYPGAIAAVVAHFEANPDADIVYGMADHIGIDGVAFEAYPTEPFDAARLRDTCFICQPALFLRRRVVARHGALDATLHYCMDYEYWLRLAGQGVRFDYLPRKLAGSRLYADNKTLGARVAVHREINDMLRRRLGRVPDRWLLNYAHAVADAHRARGTWRYAAEVGTRSLAAALRWNHAVSATMLRDCLRGGAGRA